MTNVEFLKNCSDEELADFLAKRIGCGKLFVKLWLNQDNTTPNNLNAFNKYLIYPDNLLYEVFDGSDCLFVKFSDDQKTALHECLKALPEREAFVIKSHFEDLRTYDQIGEVLNISKERVRQIIHKAIRLLRNGMNISLSVGEYITPERIVAPKEYFDVSYKPISELGLSCRSFNCLWRAGVRTIGDCLARSEAELKKIRNLGAKSYDEIRRKIDHELIASHKRQMGGDC